MKSRKKIPSFQSLVSAWVTCQSFACPRLSVYLNGNVMLGISMLSEMVRELWPDLTPTYLLFLVPFKVFCNRAKIGAWNALSPDCAASPSHRHPLTHLPPAPLLQYFALLLCIFLLEVLAGVLAYIYYQQVRPLCVDRLDIKSPLTHVCARCEKSKIKPASRSSFFTWTPVESPCTAKD